MARFGRLREGRKGRGEAKGRVRSAYGRGGGRVAAKREGKGLGRKEREGNRGERLGGSGCTQQKNSHETIGQSGSVSRV